MCVAYEIMKSPREIVTSVWNILGKLVCIIMQHNLLCMHYSKMYQSVICFQKGLITSSYLIHRKPCAFGAPGVLLCAWLEIQPDQHFDNWLHLIHFQANMLNMFLVLAFQI